MMCEEFKRAFHFVTGFIMETMSMYWWDSLCMRSRSPWPVSATSGERSRKASATPVTRFVAPGPSVPRQTPARWVRRPYMSAMYAPPCSCRTGMKSTEELASDSLRSSVSSPGIPKTYSTPSTSRHSTNRSDALRSMPETSPLRSCRANVAVDFVLMRARTLFIALALACLVPAGTAAAASRFTIRGAGFGHGVGMSQYGAYGFAQNGWAYRDILAHYYTDTAIGNLDPAQRVRVLLQSTSSASFTHATRAGRRRLSPLKTYYVRRRGASVQLLSARRKKMGTYRLLHVTGRGGAVVLRGRAANGRYSGAYRGAMDFQAGAFSGVDAVNNISLDQYVQGVVPDESPASWPIEALKAQAVAARTYAVATMKPGATFDLYPDTRSQMYGGLAAEVPSTNEAVAETRGEVVTYA